MPVFLKDIKKELESDRSKVGRKPDGSYKFTPPNIVSREINDYANLAVSKFETKPRFGINALSHTGLVSSESQAGIRYKVSVQFFNVIYKDIESKLFNIKAEMGDNIKFHKTPSVQKNSIAMRCQCNDWRHRFETPIAKAGGLIGGPRKYTRITPTWPVGYPSVNVTKKLGICKHISSMINYLESKKLLKEK